MCVVCRGRFAKSALRRYVRSPRGSMVFDPEKSAHGRGIYLCSDPCCGTKFVKYRPDAKRKGNKHA
ncbi:MAG: YlxR family protein [Desulfovibrio sp.]|nr:YlxR family protein [Desulfovibrio sp.]